MRGVRTHVKKSLDGVPEQKGDAHVVEQAVRAAAIECMEQWSEQERSGDVVQLCTISLVRITREQPGPFMSPGMTSFG
jgi:hypothetical protein